MKLEVITEAELDDILHHSHGDESEYAVLVVGILRIAYSLRVARDRVKALEVAVDDIWKGHGIVVMNGGMGWNRHVEPMIYEAHKALMEGK